jgi:tetratricopeptide (TPR) repeat protein
MADYYALMDEGRRLRAQSSFAEAQAKFDAAAAAAAPGSADFALGRYHSGLTRQDRDDDAGAVGPMEEALRIYETRPGEAPAKAVMGAALGLSLLREFRWAEAARAMEASNGLYGDSPENAASLAAGLHNLAIATTRGGDPRRGLEIARQAVALHEAIDGAAHPNTVESRLVEAFALIETGELEAAGSLIRRAARAILAGAGESSAWFADALLTEARRVARQGDGIAAEALARRAMFILKQEGAGPSQRKLRERDAAALGPLWRTGSKARDAGDVALWRVSMQHTLRSYRAATLDFVPAGSLPKEWYFFVPAGWAPSEAPYAARLAFAEANRFLNSREPADAGFLDATQATASLPDAHELENTKFAERLGARVWESSMAYSLVRGDLCVPLSPVEFARALAARGVSDAALTLLGADAGTLAAARQDPTATLQSVLF